MDFSNPSRNLQIGSYFSTLRNEQDLTIEQLAKISRVPDVHLAAIEAGQFSRFDDFYLKIYLKKYAEALAVDLDQLYAYATKQKLPEQTEDQQVTPTKKLTKTQADISTEPVAKTVAPKTYQQKIQTKGISQSSGKTSFGRIMAVLFFTVLVVAIIFVAISALQNIDRTPETADNEAPPLEIAPPAGLNPEEDDEYEEEPEPEPEPEPADETNVEFVDRFDRTQIFNVVTDLEELIIRFDLTGDNWIGGSFNRIYNNISNPFEESFEITDRIQIPIGAIHNVDAIYINDVSVPLELDGLVGTQNFIFYINPEE